MRLFSVSFLLLGVFSVAAQASKNFDPAFVSTFNLQLANSLMGKKVDAPMMERFKYEPWFVQAKEQLKAAKGRAELVSTGAGHCRVGKYDRVCWEPEFSGKSVGIKFKGYDGKAFFPTEYKNATAFRKELTQYFQKSHASLGFPDFLVPSAEAAGSDPTRVSEVGPLDTAVIYATYSGYRRIPNADEINAVAPGYIRSWPADYLADINVTCKSKKTSLRISREPSSLEIKQVADDKFQLSIYPNNILVKMKMVNGGEDAGSEVACGEAYAYDPLYNTTKDACDALAMDLEGKKFKIKNKESALRATGTSKEKAWWPFGSGDSKATVTYECSYIVQACNNILPKQVLEFYECNGSSCDGKNPLSNEKLIGLMEQIPREVEQPMQLRSGTYPDPANPTAVEEWKKKNRKNKELLSSFATFSSSPEYNTYIAKAKAREDEQAKLRQKVSDVRSLAQEMGYLVGQPGLVVRDDVDALEVPPAAVPAGADGLMLSKLKAERDDKAKKLTAAKARWKQIMSPILFDTSYRPMIELQDAFVNVALAGRCCESSECRLEAFDASNGRVNLRPVPGDEPSATPAN